MVYDVFSKERIGRGSSPSWLIIFGESARNGRRHLSQHQRLRGGVDLLLDKHRGVM